MTGVAIALQMTHTEIKTVSGPGFTASVQTSQRTEGHVRLLHNRNVISLCGIAFFIWTTGVAPSRSPNMGTNTRGHK